MRFARKRIIDFVTANLGMAIPCNGTTGYVCGYSVSHPVPDCRDIIIGFWNNDGWCKRNAQPDDTIYVSSKRYKTYLYAWSEVMAECKKQGIKL
jgi:hypothetical protein